MELDRDSTLWLQKRVSRARAELAMLEQKLARFIGETPTEAAARAQAVTEQPAEPSPAPMTVTAAYEAHLAAGKRKLRPGESVPPQGAQAAWCDCCGGCYEWGGNGLWHHAGCRKIPAGHGTAWLETIPAAQSPAAPYAHIKQPYTLAEIKAKIASHDYGAELLLQHAMLLLERPYGGAAPVEMADMWERFADEIEQQAGGVGLQYNEGQAEGMRVCARDLRAARAQPAATALTPDNQLTAEGHAVMREATLDSAEIVSRGRKET